MQSDLLSVVSELFRKAEHFGFCFKMGIITVSALIFSIEH